ncbi:MAG: sensor histidine kinase [Gemmatimonadota bacterium]
MARRAEPVPGHPRWLHGEESATASSRWWSLEDALGAAPAAARSLVEEIGARLLLDDEEAAAARPRDGDRSTHIPELTDLELAGAAVVALREAISAASARGAPGEAVRTLHRRLDREVLELARCAMGDCLADSHELLREVSHDLRSPLNSILFLADTLLTGHSGELNAVQRRQVGVLYTAAVTLVRLVNDLIDASRLGESEPISVAHISFSMESVLSDVRSLLGPLATHRGVELRFHLETVGPRSGDRQLLSRVLINLVTNAIQAVDQEGKVDVYVKEPRPGWLRAEVEDDGAGGELERIRKLIVADADPYRTGRTKGWTHGLGLAISARLVRGVGGTLDVERGSQKGTRFLVELPFERVE